MIPPKIVFNLFCEMLQTKTTFMVCEDGDDDDDEDIDELFLPNG